ncbi:MAG: AAA family ATPase [Chloroflexi bacterium]|nr:AAA family ATPase [Chloroflexota bacterium]
MISPARDPLVGRRREIDHLTTAFEEAQTQRVRFCLISGEPGIGKTRLVEELEAIVVERGARVAWGRCYERSGPAPFLAWSQLVRSLVDAEEPEILRRNLNSIVPFLSDFVTIPRAWFSERELKTVTGDPETIRFRTAGAITTFLQRTAQSRPLVIMVEDLQWADSSSLLLLEYLLQNATASPLLVIGTFRDTESPDQQFDGTIAGLTRSSNVSRIRLEGLHPDETRTLVEAIAGSMASSNLAAGVQERTSGNPLFVVEISRDLAAGGVTNIPDAPTTLPLGIREAIKDRLNRLSDRCSTVLATAAVIGVEFSITRLQIILDESLAAKLLDYLEEAMAAKVILEIQGAPGTFRFSHTLIHEVLSTNSSAAGKAHLHAGLAIELERQYGSDANSHADELEYHFRHGLSALEPAVGSSKVIRYCLLAGRRALAAFAYEQAAKYFRRGLDTVGESGNQSNPGKFYQGLAEASNPFGDPGAVVEYLAMAFTSFMKDNDKSAAINAAATGYFAWLARRLSRSNCLVERLSW